MNFVTSNEIDKQSILAGGSQTHYIFVLDDSGSMHTNNKWDDLMSAFKNTIETIKALPHA